MKFNSYTNKEIVKIVFTFLIIFFVLSLITYDPRDVVFFEVISINTNVNNWFGILGSYLANIFILYFGGISILVFVLIILIFKYYRKDKLVSTLFIIPESIFLIILTSCIFSFKQDHYLFFNQKFFSGGIISVLLKNFIIQYHNQVGGLIILCVMWIIFFFIITKLSILSLYNFVTHFIFVILNKITTIFFNNHKTNIKKRKITKCKYKNNKINKYLAKKNNKNILATKQSKYIKPNINLLDNAEKNDSVNEINELKKQAKIINNKLKEFSIKGKVIEINSGPILTTFEYKPSLGIKIKKIINLSDDLALALQVSSINLIPILGKSVVGIEIPKNNRKIISFKEMINSKDFIDSDFYLTLCLGKNVIGNPIFVGLEKMPHLLIAGATGTGKSTAINSIICSLLYKLTPNQVKFIIIDPKKVELSEYDGIPHLLFPILSSAKETINSLFWAIKEMKNRYTMFFKSKAKNIYEYNNKKNKNEKKIPFIVIIIDELADLMTIASDDIEKALIKLAQMARAAGIHLILATQRPSVNIITGTIKANFPTRISFQMSSKIDSRVIIDNNGAETLLGNGDMLFMTPGIIRLQRIHGTYISSVEISKITQFLKQQNIKNNYEKLIENDHKNESVKINIK